MDSKVTIGMPVYNVERYLKKSLLSALEQTYSNIEVLVVDDCGNDHSMDIVYDLQKNHNNGGKIKVLKHSVNKGLAAARNTIIDNASGKYILFLDSDDYLSLDAVEILCSNADKYNSQVTYGSVRHVDISGDENNPVISYVKLPSVQLLEKDSFANYVCQDIHYHIYVTSWNILFLTEFITSNNLRFFITRRGEDILFCSDFYPLVERGVLLSDITYNYLLRTDSLMGRQQRQKISVEEVLIHLRNDDYLAQRCLSLKNKSYYDVHCSKVVRYKFSTICAVLKHKSQLSGEISNELLKKNLRHPATFSEILRFHRYRCFNLFFYFLSFLPASVVVAIIYLLGKKKNYI